MQPTQIYARTLRQIVKLEAHIIVMQQQGISYTHIKDKCEHLTYLRDKAVRYQPMMNGSVRK